MVVTETVLVTPRAARTVTVTRAGGPGNSDSEALPVAGSESAASGLAHLRQVSGCRLRGRGPWRAVHWAPTRARAGLITRGAAAGGGGPRGGRRSRPSEPEAPSQPVPPPLAAA
jgi:hypothetical protein